MPTGRPRKYTPEEAKIRHKEACARWRAKNTDYFKESHRKTMLNYSRLRAAFQKLRMIDDSIFT